MTVSDEISRGDIYYIAKDSDRWATGSEIYAGRHAVVVSNDTYNKTARNVQVCYLTTNPRGDGQNHVVIRSMERHSVCLAEQIFTIDKSRIGDKMGEVTGGELYEIDTAIRAQLGLTAETRRFAPGPAEDSSEAITLAAERDTYRKMYYELLDRVTK